MLRRVIEIEEEKCNEFAEHVQTPATREPSVL